MPVNVRFKARLAVRAASKGRRRNRARPTSGLATRRSTSANSTPRTTAAANRASTSGSPKPRVCPAVSAYSTAKAAPPVVATPARSTPRGAASSRDSAVAARTTRRVTAAMGTLTRKIQRQPVVWVSRPPNAGPTACPPQATAAHTPSARGCSDRGNWGGMSARVMGRISAAPTPMAARPMMSTVGFGAPAATSDARAKTTVPVTSMRRRPSRSPSLPPAITSDPVDTVNAMLAHCRVVRLALNSLAIVGSATGRSDAENHTSAAAAQMPASEVQRRGDRTTSARASTCARSRWGRGSCRAR